MRYLYVDGMRCDVADLHLVQHGNRRSSVLERYCRLRERASSFIPEHLLLLSLLIVLSATINSDVHFL